MRSILFITSNDDLKEMPRRLEDLGLAATTVRADGLYEDNIPKADAAVLDLRGLSANQRADATDALERCALLAVALVDEETVGLVSVDSGYEDFIVVPAQVREVARRLERAIWRRHGIDSENRVVCGTLSIDLSNYRVTVNGELVGLTFKEYELLRFLALNTGRVFTREQLLSRVWGYDYFGGARTVDVHVRRIRSKVETRGQTFIETVRNVGYRLVDDTRKHSGELTEGGNGSETGA